ncbi:hypothetical protein BJX99DRAFT_238219 [Aspergillus californicus]
MKTPQAFFAPLTVSIDADINRYIRSSPTPASSESFCAVPRLQDPMFPRPPCGTCTRHRVPPEQCSPRNHGSAGESNANLLGRM